MFELAAINFVHLAPVGAVSPYCVLPVLLYCLVIQSCLEHSHTHQAIHFTLWDFL
jgi:hypothetical protein